MTTTGAEVALAGPDAQTLANLSLTWVQTTLLGLYLAQAGRFRWVNAQFARDTGYALDQMVGSPSLALVHPDDRLLARAHAIAMLQGRRTTPYAFRYVTATGAVRWALQTVASVPVAGERAVVGTFLDITRQKQLEAQLAHQATHDGLTNLPNRTLVLDRLQQALVHGRRTGQMTVVLYLDLDDFKAVNDRLGHHAGDGLLQAVARRLQQSVRAVDTVGRLGGDEFGIVLVDVTATLVQTVTETIRQRLSAPYILGGHRVQVRTSIGVACSSTPATDPEALLQAADLALYAAKAQGKDGVVMAP